MHLPFRCFDNRNLYFLFINIFLFIYFRKYLIFERFSIRISILFQRLIFCLERLSWHCFRFIGFLLYWIVRLVVLASRISCWDFSPSPAELLIQSPIICPIVKNWTKLKFHRTDTSQRIISGVKNNRSEKSCWLRSEINLDIINIRKMRNIQAQKSEASFGQQVIWQYWKDGEEIYSLFVTDSKLPYFKAKSVLEQN